MAKKKKKMTAAQAAAARREPTESATKHAMAKERSKLIRASAESAKKKANQNLGLRMVLPFIIVGLIIISAIALTVGPGMFLGK